MVKYTKSLDVLRKKIDSMDNSLMKNIFLRFNIVKKVGKFKKSHSIPLCDRKRQAEVLKLRIKQGKKQGLDPIFIKKLHTLVFNEAIRIQRSGK
jgi:chorismate mutase